MVRSRVNSRRGITAAKTILQMIDFDSSAGVEHVDRGDAVRIVSAQESIFGGRVIVDVIREIERTTQPHRDSVAIKGFEVNLARAVCPN